MTYALIVTDRAQADLLDIYEWIAQDAPENAGRFHKRLELAIASLADLPQRCPLAPENEDSTDDFRHLIVGNYRIVFKIIQEQVIILRVRHAARRPADPGE